MNMMHNSYSLDRCLFGNHVSPLSVPIILKFDFKCPSSWPKFWYQQILSHTTCPIRHIMRVMFLSTQPPPTRECLSTSCLHMAASTSHRPHSRGLNSSWAVIKIYCTLPGLPPNSYRVKSIVSMAHGFIKPHAGLNWEPSTNRRGIYS